MRRFALVLVLRDKFRQLRDVSVGVTATPYFDPEIVQEVARALEEFHAPKPGC